MPFTFACPECRQPLRAPEAAVAHWGQCPHCTIAFQIPEVPRTAAANDLPAFVASPALVSSADGWRTVRTGLRIYGAGLIVGMFGIMIAIMMVGTNLAMGIGSFVQDAGAFAELYNLITGLIGFAGMIALLAGQFLCCAAPRESRAKATAIVAMICLAVALLAAMLFGLLLWSEISLNDPWRMRQPGLFRSGIRPALVVVIGTASFLGFLGHILFARFVKITATCFRNDSLARATTIYLCVFSVFGCAVLVTCFLLFVRALDGRPGTPAAHIQVLGIGAVFALCVSAFFLWFLKLTGRARRTIARALKSTA
jgi:hypothetical protein